MDSELPVSLAAGGAAAVAEDRSGLSWRGFVTLVTLLMPSRRHSYSWNFNSCMVMKEKTMRNTDR